MPLRQYIAFSMLFYLLFLQVNMLIGHSHEAKHVSCSKEKIINTAHEKSDCKACIAESVKPAVLHIKAFLLPSIYAAQVKESVSFYNYPLIPGSHNSPKDRGPPASSIV